jgi:zinc protease
VKARSLGAFATAIGIAAITAWTGCGASRVPLPPPVSPLSATPALPTPADIGEMTAGAPVLPAVQSLTLASGITVQLVPRHEAPVVYVALAGRGASGRTDMATNAIDALVVRTLGAGLPRALGEVQRGDDMVSAHVSGRGLITASRATPGDVERTLDRLAMLVEGRGLDEAELERARAALLEHARFETSQRRQRTYAPPDEELFTRLYGEHDPRVTSSRILAANVEPLTLARVRRRIAQFLRPGAIALIVVGDFDPERVEAAIRARWDGLAVAPSTTRSEPLSAPTFPTPSPRLRIYPTDDDPRSVVRMVERGPPRDHADHPAFCVLSRLAGGMFGAAINLRFREERGDTYGMGTRVIDEVDHTLLEMQMVVPVSSAGDAATAMVQELERLGDASRIEEGELARARTVELAGRAASLDSSWGTTSALAMSFLVDEPPESILETHARIASVTREDVAAVARRWLRPEHAPMVIVGSWSWMISHPVRVPGGIGIIGM